MTQNLKDCHCKIDDFFKLRWIMQFQNLIPSHRSDAMCFHVDVRSLQDIGAFDIPGDLSQDKAGKMQDNLTVHMKRLLTSFTSGRCTVFGHTCRTWWWHVLLYRSMNELPQAGKGSSAKMVIGRKNPHTVRGKQAATCCTRWNVPLLGHMPNHTLCSSVWNTFPHFCHSF